MASKTDDQETNVTEKVRIDKWLWFARFFKTRTLAAAQVTGGHMRVNSQPVRKAGYQVKIGDILTFPKEKDIRVIEVIAMTDRRRGAPEAALLYNDLDPPVRKKKEEIIAGKPEREPGTGRPTKKERRATDRLRDI